MGRVFALAAVCALGACARGGAGSAPESQSARVGSPAPSWSDPSLPGPKLNSSALRGKAVYLNFFATWCPPCNQEAPEIDALQRSFATQGLQVVGVDVLENSGKAKDFRSRHHLIYPVVVDSGTLRDEYNVNGLPVHVFIDRGGIVRKIVVGEISPAEMRSNVERILR